MGDSFDECGEINVIDSLTVKHGDEKFARILGGGVSGSAVEVPKASRSSGLVARLWQWQGVISFRHGAFRRKG